jgi:hypothetical protein
MRRSTLWALGVLLVGLIAVAGLPHRAPATEPGLNRITQVQVGWTMLQVLQTLGAPSDIVGHTFYYKDMGKVIFASESNPLDKTKVQKIEPSVIQNPVP